jgi:hypothetical protein
MRIDTAKPRAPTQPSARGALEATSYAAALAALAIGLPLWLISARYTLDGWVIALNWCAAFLRISAQVPIPAGVWMLLIIPVGVVYSLVERKGLPLNPQAAGYSVWALLLVVWIVINATDVGSTLLGVLAVGADAWAIQRWMASTLWAAGLWAIILTYLPESLLLLAWWIVRWK